MAKGVGLHVDATSERRRYLWRSYATKSKRFLTLYNPTLKMESVCSSVMSVSAYKNTRCHSPENQDFNILIPLSKWVFTHIPIQFRSLDSSVGTATGKRAGRLGFDSRHGKTFPYSTASRPALRPNQPRIQWVLGAISSEEKQPGREAGHTSI
jgi:hypothetical protein